MRSLFFYFSTALKNIASRTTRLNLILHAPEALRILRGEERNVAVIGA